MIRWREESANGRRDRSQSAKDSVQPEDHHGEPEKDPRQPGTDRTQSENDSGQSEADSGQGLLIVVSGFLGPPKPAAKAAAGPHDPGVQIRELPPASVSITSFNRLTNDAGSSSCPPSASIAWSKRMWLQSLNRRSSDSSFSRWTIGCCGLISRIGFDAGTF